MDSGENEKFERGVELMREGRFEEAGEIFAALVGTNPQNNLARLNLAIAYLDQHRFREAGVALREYLDRTPGDALAHVRMGYIQYKLGHNDVAIRSLRQALALEPHCAPAYRYLGDIFLESNKVDEARTAFARALKLNPRYADAMCGLAECFHRKKMPGVAIDYYRQALERVNPSDAGEIYEKVGRLYFENEVWGDTIKAHERAIELGAADERINYELGVAYLKTGDQASAASEYQTLKSLGSSYAPKLGALLGEVEEESVSKGPVEEGEAGESEKESEEEF